MKRRYDDHHHGEEEDKGSLGSGGAISTTKSVKFVRSFGHVDGNWPSHVYITCSGSSKLYALYNQCLAHFLQHSSFAQLTTGPVIPSSDASSSSSSNVLDLVIEEKPHLSISRPFILRFHQIASFTKKLKDLLQLEISRFTLELSTSYRILLNDAKTRAFVCVLVPVSSFSFATLQKLVTHVVDPALLAFNQSAYYENPIFHVSIASFIPNEELLSHIEEVQNRIFHFSDSSVEVKEAFFPVSATDSEEDEIEVGKSPWVETDIVLKQEKQSCGTVLELLGDYDSAEEDVEVQDSVGYLLRLSVSTIVCRIGDREHICTLLST